MIFIDDLSDRALELLEKYPFVSGITTNSSILKSGGYTLSEAVSVLRDVRGVHFIQGSLKDEEWSNVLLKQNLSEKFVVKLVWVPGSVERIAQTLKENGYKICATAVYTTGQGLSALEFGVDWIAVYYDRMARNGMNPSELITWFLKRNANVLVASLKSVDQIEKVLRLGNVSVTLPTNLFEEFVRPVFPEDDFERFEGDFRL